ncbi:hypothetical protein NUSPORA_02383 [Nucleospora cyclopteri]
MYLVVISGFVVSTISLYQWGPSGFISETEVRVSPSTEIFNSENKSAVLFLNVKQQETPFKTIRINICKKFTPWRPRSMTK